jgi:hypothetical protein
MAKQHGKNTVVKIAANDISQYCNASELTRSGDTHDTTTYGNNSHRYNGGLLDGKFTCSGQYDTTAGTGPRAVMVPALGTTQTVTRRPEGTGSGKPQDLFSAVLATYVETNPVADMVTWSSEWTIDGDVDSTPQP